MDQVLPLLNNLLENREMQLEVSVIFIVPTAAARPQDGRFLLAPGRVEGPGSGLLRGTMVYYHNSNQLNISKRFLMYIIIYHHFMPALCSSS